MKSSGARLLLNQFEYLAVRFFHPQPIAMSFLPNHHEWQLLQSGSDLSAALERSIHQPVALFKHSIRCGISSHALHRLSEEWDFSSSEVAMYCLDLINFRDISNQITELLGVAHQSPQLILVHNQQPVYHISHMGVSGSALRNALNGLTLQER
jgi:bacillithiol system protein YtxJ